MRRVGTLTFHFVENIGAALQCVALYRVLKDMGYDCEVINYCPEYHTSRYSVIYRPFKTIAKDDSLLTKTKKVCKQLALNVRIPERISKKRKFTNFLRENVKLTKRYKTIKELEAINAHKDVVIVGSDQIWNPMYTENTIDEAYLLSFFKGKKMSYAASSGKVLSNEIIKQNLSLFRSFDEISVREMSLATILRDHEISSRIDIDPALLLTSNEWDKICKLSSVAQANYILVYALEENPGLTEIVNYYKAKLGLPVIDVSPRDFLGQGVADKHKKNIGPGEFVAIVKDAAITITNSFHGTVFSIIYEKEFVSIPHSKTPERVKDLLHSLDLNNRLCYDVSNLSKLETIDYDLVRSKLNLLCDRSLSYLKGV